MSDDFDKKMQEIAQRSVQNGGPTIDDVLTALCATHNDNEEAHREIVQKIDADILDTRKRIGTVEKAIFLRNGGTPPADMTTANRTFFMWSVGSKVIYILIAVLVAVISLGTNYLLFGQT